MEKNIRELLVDELAIVADNGDISAMLIQMAYEARNSQTEGHEIGCNFKQCATTLKAFADLFKIAIDSQTRVDVAEIARMAKENEKEGGDSESLGVKIRGMIFKV